MKLVRLIIFDLDDTLFDTTGTLDATYKNLPFIAPFQGVKQFLQKVTCTKTLVTKGDVELQNQKIDILGIRSFFSKIIITETDEEKLVAFKSLISHSNISDMRHVLVVGNRIDSEIRYGNMLGCRTVFVKHGKYAYLAPKDAFEIPQITVENTADISVYF